MKKTEAKYRGIRYWFIWFMGIVAPLVLLLQAYYNMRIEFTIGFLIYAVILFLIFLAFAQAFRGTAPTRFPVFHSNPEILGFEFEEVEFTTQDGLKLEGWFVAPPNGAMIVITHGYGGNRLSTTPIARFLVKAGFGILVYDLRAHGRNPGDLSTWGWLEINDLLGAVNYLLTRSEVDKQRIGLLGYSLGGQISLRAAAQMKQIRAVAVDGPTVAALDDHKLSNRLTLRKILFYPWVWLQYQLRSFIIGAPVPNGICEEIGKIAPRSLMLISSGRGVEQRIIHHFYELAGEPKTLYEIPEARHNEGVLARPDEYEKRLVEFFKQAL